MKPLVKLSSIKYHICLITKLSLHFVFVVKHSMFRYYVIKLYFLSSYLTNVKTYFIVLCKSNV